MKKLMLAALVSTALVATASRDTAAGMTYNSVKVVDLMVTQNAGLDVTFTNNICDDASASAKNVGRFVAAPHPDFPNATADGVKSITDILLAAKLNGREVIVLTQGVSENYACKIYGVQLK
jgi:hypothetical protein